MLTFRHGILFLQLHGTLQSYIFETKYLQYKLTHYTK